MKNLSLWCLCLVGFLSTGYLSYTQTQSDISLKEDEQLIEYTTDRFTLPNIHVTPDKKYIIFDVLGDIYQVPIEGGKAKILLQDSNWKRGAKLSPDGKTLAYISDEMGEFQVWTYDMESHEKTEYPIFESFHYPLYAYWSGDNELLIPNKDGLNNFKILSRERQLLHKAEEDENSIMHTVNRTMFISYENNSAYFQKKGELWKYDIINKKEYSLGDIPIQGSFDFFKISPNGKVVLFYIKNQEDHSKQDFIYWNLQTEEVKILNNTLSPGASIILNYSFDFLNNHIIILSKDGEIVKMNIDTGEYEPIPIEVAVKKVIKKPLHREPQYIRDSVITASVLRNPITHPDLDTIYFGAFGKLHTYSKTTGAIKEVYPNKDRFEVSPSLSPDGRYLAYTTWNDWEMGHLYVREVSTGKEHQITQQPGRYINPAWSPDGTEIVFIADETEAKLGLKRQKIGGNIYKYKLDVYSIKLKKGFNQDSLQNNFIYRVYPFSELPRRFYPVPIFCPDGKSILVTTRNHKKNIPTIIQLDLNTKNILNEAIIPFHTDEILISPDTKHIALIFDEQVWLSKFPYITEFKFLGSSDYTSNQTKSKESYTRDIRIPNLKVLYEIAPSYLYWQDKQTLMWGSTDEIYTYNLKTQEVTKLASIKVQKPRAVPKAQYALTNARITTMNPKDQVIEEGTILVRDNRIEAVGETTKIKIPKDYKIFDLSGKTIIPGLIDVHAHYLLEPYEFFFQQNYKLLGGLAFGVTTIYDPSVNVLDYREQAQLVEVGSLLGPRIFGSGNIILGKPGPYEYDYKTIESVQDASRIVKSLIKLKANGPIKEYGITNLTKRHLLREAASKNNIGITAHQDYFTHSMSRIIDGYTSIEHQIGSIYLQDDVTKLLGESGVNYTPTYIVRPGFGLLYRDKTEKERDKFLRFNSNITLFNSYENIYEPQGKKKQKIITNWDLGARSQHIRIKKTLKKIKKLGGLISVGGHGNPLPGIGTHWETWFVSGGIGNYEALKAATINGAMKLDLNQEIGSLEEGKLADILVLNSNPLEDVFQTTNIQYTILNGIIYDANTLSEIYPKEEALLPWGWDNPMNSIRN